MDPAFRPQLVGWNAVFGAQWYFVTNIGGYQKLEVNFPAPTPQ